MKRFYVLLIIIGILVMLKPINSIIKDSISNIMFRGNVVTGIVATDNGDGSYDVFISESDRAYPKIFTLSRNPDLAVGNKVRILYKNGCKELPIILPPTTGVQTGLFESCVTTDPSMWMWIDAPNKKMMQSFIAISNHGVNRVSIIIGKRNTNNLGTITLGIYSVNESGYPTGDVLTTGTINGNSLGLWSETEVFVDFTVTEISIIKDIKYAIVISSDAYGYEQYLEWGAANTDISHYIDIYPEGNFDRYNGTSWDYPAYALQDGQFKIYRD